MNEFVRLEEEKTECLCDCCNGTCDDVQTNDKIINIDFLYLDLSVCERCQDTETILEEAVESVKTVLELTGINVHLSKVNVNSEELAIQHRFISSPTIRINGHDIQLEVKENACDSCAELCGSDVDCRVWVYKEQEYTSPPKPMIIEAILKAVYGTKEELFIEEPYTIPDNLKKFYTSINQK